MRIVSCNVTFRDRIRVQKKEIKNSLLVLLSSTKHEIRKFHVIVVVIRAVTVKNESIRIIVFLINLFHSFFDVLVVVAVVLRSLGAYATRTANA